MGMIFTLKSTRSLRVCESVAFWKNQHSSQLLNRKVSADQTLAKTQIKKKTTFATYAHSIQMGVT